MSPLKSYVTTFGLALFLMSPALAQTTPEQPPDQPPQRTHIPRLHCEMKTLVACDAQGACKAGADIQGMKLPMLVSVDFENGIVSSIGPEGFPRTDKTDAVIKTQEQLILHGIDGEFAWQLAISDQSEIASVVMSTADVSISAFGSCAKAK
jgi:hypothetical protein